MNINLQNVCQIVSDVGLTYSVNETEIIVNDQVNWG